MSDVEKGAKIRRIEGNLENPAAALKQVGILMVAESQQAFRDQKLGDKVWDARGPINIMGIIADFHAGKKEPAARRFERRPVLMDTGRLRASIAYQLVSNDTVEVGSNLPYAATQHHGGESESKPINEQVRSALNAWLKKKGKPYRRSLGWLLNKKFRDKTITTTVKARPIVAVTKQTIEDVQEVVRVKIMEAG